MSEQLIKISQLTSRLKLWKGISFLLLLVFLFMMNYVDINHVFYSNNYIAKLSISGTISTDDDRDYILNTVATNKKIKGVILEIDSPGGTFVGSEILYNNIRNIANHKPVVAVLKNFSASGGYMVALAADYIIAYNGTITGSIGVITRHIEVTELAKKLGINIKSIKSSEIKGAMSPFETITPKAEQNITSLINDSYKYFINLVAQRRQLPMDKVLEIADGRVYTGSQSVKLGLIDKIGDEKEALKWFKNHNITTHNIRSIKLHKNSNPIKNIISMLNNMQNSLTMFLY